MNLTEDFRLICHRGLQVLKVRHYLTCYRPKPRGSRDAIVIRMATSPPQEIQTTGYYDDNEDSSFSEDGGDEEVEEDDRDTLKAGVQALGISKYYIAHWGKTEAFREFYQNWWVVCVSVCKDLADPRTRKDGIIKSFDLDPRRFEPKFKDSKNQILIKVYHPQIEPTSPGKEKLLGFIRFDKKAGSLELTNFNAALTRRNLDLGDTTKYESLNQAGCHGEGFKLASLVMCRNGHRVRYSTSYFKWFFGLRGNWKSNLYCKIVPESEKKLKRDQDTYKAKIAAGKQRALKANIWEDVSVLIGKGRGDLQMRIELHEFLEWLEVTVDINAPCDVVKTQYGDLILDRKFTGKMYLKGLFLANASTTGK